ncbi:MAG: hypothetical protein PHY03_02225 [Dehalococcoidia bacterium]|nr:hypothetical protein [Dehalococcoidia bacterium]
MPEHKRIYTTFSEADLKGFEPELKVGLLATVNEEELPHITLITTLTANSPRQLFWGQFSEGLSKEYIRKNPKTGFLIMTLDKNIWRGKANFTKTAVAGKEYTLLNSTPMFRYNAYFGIHTIYYLDLIEQQGKEPLPMGGIIRAAIKTLAAKTLSGKGSDKEVINPLTHSLIDKVGNLKFLSYTGEDGYPVIIPVMQAQTVGSGSIIFSSSVYVKELKLISQDMVVAIFCMSLDMQTVLLRGVFKGFKTIAGLECGRINVDWVYNPMPPKPEQIYPEKKLQAVTAF